MHEENRANYEDQRKDSDKTLNHAIQIAASVLDIDLSTGEYDIIETSLYEDTKLCSDLKLVKLPSKVMEKGIGHRCRNEDVLDTYPTDVTFRLINKEGYNTEFHKILYEKRGDYNLYCFDINSVIVRWIFMNLDNFRKAHTYDSKLDEWCPHPLIKTSWKSNKTKSDTDFVAYDMLSVWEYDQTVPCEDRIIMAHDDGYFDNLIQVTEYTQITKNIKIPFTKIKLKENSYRIKQ